MESSVNDVQKLKKSSQKVQDFLAKHGSEFRVHELDSDTRTAVAAAESIGCDVSQIVKSLIFCTKETNRPILVLMNGLDRVDEKFISKLVGEKIMRASADFTREVTGFAIGGIPPVAHKEEIETYIDKSLLKHDVLWAAAGTPNSVFSVKSSDLLDLTKGTLF